MKSWKACLILTTFAVATGCNSGPSDSTPLSDLTDTDAQVLCEEFLSDAFVPTREQTCTFGALFVATDEAMCVAARDACLDMEPTPTEETDCADASAAVLEACTDVSVGDLRACRSAQAALLQDIFSRSVCTNAGTDEAPTSEELSTVPPECEAINACRMM